MASTQCRIIAALGLTDLSALERLEPGEELGLVGRVGGVGRRGHNPPSWRSDPYRARRAMPSPALAMISRCTSFTPPPNVFFCDARPARSAPPSFPTRRHP